MAARKSKAKGQKPASRKIRSLRHWKQQYDKNAAFVWRKSTTWNGVEFSPGDLVPAEIIAEMGPTKQRRFWESQFIELAEFEEPENVGFGMPQLSNEFMRGEVPQEDAGGDDAIEAPVPSDAAPELKERAVEGFEGEIEPTGEE